MTNWGMGEGEDANVVNGVACGEMDEGGATSGEKVVASGGNCINGLNTGVSYKEVVQGGRGQHVGKTHLLCIVERARESVMDEG